MTAAKVPKPRKTRTRPLSPKKSMPSIIPIADIPLVPVGCSVGFSGMNADMVKKCGEAKRAEKTVCWNDCHEFDWEPCRIPLLYNKQLGMCYSQGNFCSFSCAKTYCMHNRLSKGGGVTYIALEANRSRRRYMGTQKGVNDVIYVKSVPVRERLKMFGGSMSIDEFRKGSLRFDGTLIGGENSDILEDLMRGRTTRADLAPPVFVDENAVQTLRCICAPGSGVPKPLQDDSLSTFGVLSRRSSNKCRVRNLCTNESIRQRMQQTSTRPPTEGNLFTSMGIIVESKGD
ncbi:hypothetical protein JKP88DRAFT_241067 [Tribonema minus]|uniref:Uncharacterized protein n=1 Tax=Tribonema minus TaxID=303371 RepID=A0A836CI69_9STRA|nr:hypothetical protein JKP88DRAFT_241067 [Tribonema minus]